MFGTYFTNISTSRVKHYVGEIFNFLKLENKDNKKYFYILILRLYNFPEEE